MIRAAALALLLASLAPSAASGQAGDWPEITPAETATRADIERMAADFQHCGSLALREAQAAIEARDGDGVRQALARFAAMGGELSARGRDAVREFYSDEQWTAFLAAMAENERPVEASRPAGEVPARLGLIEGIAYVPVDDHLVVSSVTERTVFGLTDRGWDVFGTLPHGEQFEGFELGSPMGMTYDPDRGWLWVASGAVDQTPDPETAFAGLIGIGPGRNEVLRMPIAEGGQPGDVALGPDGSVYLSDGATGAIYVRRIGEVRLDRLLAPGRLRSPQGMAVSADRSALIVSDYHYGLARLDFATGALDRIAYDGLDMLDGIDALIADGDSVIAIRNGVTPHAILRLALDPSGRRVQSVEVLERSNPGWGEPTLGTIHDGILYYVADARWTDFGEGGTLTAGAPPRPTRIRALRLDQDEK